MYIHRMAKGLGRSSPSAQNFWAKTPNQHLQGDSNEPPIIAVVGENFEWHRLDSFCFLLQPKRKKRWTPVELGPLTCRPPFTEEVTSPEKEWKNICGVGKSSMLKIVTLYCWSIFAAGFGYGIIYEIGAIQKCSTTWPHSHTCQTEYQCHAIALLVQKSAISEH